MNAENEFQARLDLPSWRFKPSNLGCLCENAGAIEFKPLTLVCGPNNTGKTWVLYALYGFLQDSGFIKLPGLESLTDSLMREGQATWDMAQWMKDHTKKIISAINQASKRRLATTFNSSPDFFKDSAFDWDVHGEHLADRAIARRMDFRLLIGREKNEVLRLLKPAGESVVQLTLLSAQLPDAEYILADAITRHLIGNPPRRNVFLMPAERNGLHLFYRELSNRRTALLHHATKKDKDLDIGQLIRDVARSRYAQPIADYIDWLNALPGIRKRKGGGFHALAEEIKQLAGGRYEVDAEGEISFTPYKLKRGENHAPPKMDLHLTSSTVKSLFGLWAYLEFEAQPGDVLMIDEPELNLHPSNQRRLARMLARLTNGNLRVIISTHSDYLVREMNSLLMLSKPGTVRDELMQRFGYQEAEILDPGSVAAWLFSDRTISPMEIDAIEGIDAKTFDDEIHALNETSDDIYYAYQEGDQRSGE